MSALVAVTVLNMPPLLHCKVQCVDRADPILYLCLSSIRAPVNALQFTLAVINA
jgi:hypothetical protein